MEDNFVRKTEVTEALAKHTSFLIEFTGFKPLVQFTAVSFVTCQAVISDIWAELTDV